MPNFRQNRYVLFGWGTAVAAIVLLATLLVRLWPPDLFTALILAGLIMLLLATVVVVIRRQLRDVPPWAHGVDSQADMSGEELVDYRLRSIAEYERRLELRELRLARQIRTSQFSHDDYTDLVQIDPTDEELEALAEKDRQLIGLIEAESQLAFNRILENRYASDDGVNTPLILKDIRTFVEQVAELYQPETADPLLETDIELIAKSLSSVSLHLLIVVESLPGNLKSYNTAKVYRLVRRGASYYGTYKAFRPYMEQGLNALQVARLALGMNPIAVGASWLAGKLTTYGAKAIGERVLQRRSLQLINDFIRVIGFEAAMVYGGEFRHRDANWVLGAELVNLEISRGADLGGRDAAIKKICSLVLRHEFDRIHLLSNLSRHKSIDVSGVRPQIVMTEQEREAVAAELVRHGTSTQADFAEREIVRWREAAEANLSIIFPDAVIAAAKTGRRQRNWRGGRRAPKELS